MELLLAFLGGLVIGGMTVRLVYRLNHAGTLYINDLNPDEEPYVFLELDRDIYDLYLEEYITLRVNLKREDSQR